MWGKIWGDAMDQKQFRVEWKPDPYEIVKTNVVYPSARITLIKNRE